MLKSVFTATLWDEAQKKMKMTEFVITVNPDKLPVTVLQKAKSSKTGKSKMGGGAITIESINPEPGKKIR